MPIYEYRCENGHTFEVMQRMSDEPLATCPEHDAPVQRVFHPVAIHFKGKGFYNTDYGKKSRAGKDGDSKSESKETSSSSSDSGSSADSGSGSSSSSSSESKTSAGSSSKSSD